VRWWPQTAEQSWMFCLVGSNLESDFWPADLKPGPGPGWIAPYVQGALEGRLLFVLQPKEAGAPRAFISQSAVELKRWVHVAVSYDGQIVSFWLDGQPDGTYANTGSIRPSQAPLLLGNLFDTRFLTEFGGDLRQQPSADTKPWYTFEGSIDELRISSVARSQFPPRNRR
jgi:hypothetical protein